ncbi:MAG: hypothetical protein HYZ57_19715 [Acidobacteria bacterium]|nr:hypothetical protein [Acidobacteriota bacterium]MBI3282056.1 hypothetical protein [Acidobacteriota bacterium]
MTVLTQWGPALLVVLGVMFGVMYNNARITHLDQRISDLMRLWERQHDSLKELFRAEIGRVENRLGRVETQLDRLQQRMDALEVRMDGLEARMERLEGRMDGLEARMDRLEKTVVGQPS